MRRLTVRSIQGSELSVKLLDPFVIACTTVTTTRNVLVTVEAEDERGLRASGLGEAATLVPVTAEDQGDVLAAIEAAAPELRGASFEAGGGWEALGAALDHALGGSPVARSGAEAALLDAAARLAEVPLRVLLGGDVGARTLAMTTDITIPIRDVATMAKLAQTHRAEGFLCFKVKVGRDVDHDAEALLAIAKSVPDARFRIDANGGFSARQAIELMEQLGRRGILVECFEQPCAEEDLDGSAEVARAISVPVIADESVKRVADVARLAEAGAAGGVNLKIAKSGGVLGALAIGRAAQAAGLRVMCGGMVETRLGMATAAHVVGALGGVDFVDLDTAWLLRDDPFEGGYSARGPCYTLLDRPGTGVSRR